MDQEIRNYNNYLREIKIMEKSRMSDLHIAIIIVIFSAFFIWVKEQIWK